MSRTTPTQTLPDTLYKQMVDKENKIRTFETGATRDTAEDKPDYEGFLSPTVIKRYGEYMLKHQKQSDGNMRKSDNWQLGIPKAQYMKSMFRHFMEVWTLHRKVNEETEEDIDDVLCALLFNVMGMLHEELKVNKERIKTNGE